MGESGVGEYKIRPYERRVVFMVRRSRQSIRMRGYDYSLPNYYFVTFCTQGKQCLFGDIDNGQLELNNIGKLILSEWKNVIDSYTFAIIDEHVIMPNYLHAIIKLNHYVYLNTHRRGESCIRPPDSPVKPTITGTNKNSLDRIIQHYKSKTTHIYTQQVKQGKALPFQKRLWQRNYHDHVIRNDQELLFIRRYIQTNPKRWGIDKFNIG